VLAQTSAENELWREVVRRTIRPVRNPAVVNWSHGW